MFALEKMIWYRTMELMAFSSNENNAPPFWIVPDFEFGKMGLPKPDLVLCLDMPVELAEELMRQREAAAVRLILAGKTAGFAAEKIRERLRDLYA